MVILCKDVTAEQRKKLLYFLGVRGFMLLQSGNENKDWLQDVGSIHHLILDTEEGLLSGWNHALLYEPELTCGFLYKPDEVLDWERFFSQVMFALDRKKAAAVLTHALS